MQSDDEEQLQEEDQQEEQQPQQRMNARPRNNKYDAETGPGTGTAARRTGTVNRDGSTSPVSPTFGTATGSLSQPLKQFTSEELDQLKEQNSQNFGKRPGRIDARPRNNIYMPGTGPGTGRTAIRVGTINRDGSTSPVSAMGSATGSLSHRTSKLMTPRPTPADAYEQRQSNVALAKANGSFDSIRAKFNSANSGQIMDEHGNISKNPNSPKFDQVPDGLGGYKMVPVPPKQTPPPAQPKPLAATPGLDGTIKASTEQFGSNPMKGLEMPKPLVPPVLAASNPAPAANITHTQTVVSTPSTATPAATGTSSPPSSLSMPSTGTLQMGAGNLGSGAGTLGQNNGPLKLPDPAKKPPARAKGGPVRAGKPYLVGEEGPEIIVPKQSGTVVPNHAISIAALMEMMRSGKKIVLPKGAVGAKFFETRPAPQKKACRGRR